MTDGTRAAGGGARGRWSGAQSGVIALPVLVTAAVDESAVALTRRAYRLKLAGPPTG